MINLHGLTKFDAVIKVTCTGYIEVVTNNSHICEQLQGLSSQGIKFKNCVPDNTYEAKIVLFDIAELAERIAFELERQNYTVKRLTFDSEVADKSAIVPVVSFV